MEQVDYKEKYEEIIKNLKEAKKSMGGYTFSSVVDKIIPELQENEDEKIRKEIIKFLQLPHPQFVGKRNHEEWIAWLEKQGGITKLSEEEQNSIAYGVLTSCASAFIDYLDAHKYEGKMCVSNGECEDIENAFHNAMFDKLHRYYCKYIEKQGEQEQLYIRFGDIPTDEKSKIYQGETEVGTENGVSVYPAFRTNEGNIVLGLSLPITKTTLYTQQHLIEYDNRPCYLVKGDYVGKDTDGQPLINNVSIIKKIDNYRVKEENQCEQNPTDKTEPKFKVKYAGNEYNVFEVKDIAGVTYYGIEDEPKRIDYVKAETCEMIGGYTIKENGLPNPTKPAVFSEQNPAWSEEDERICACLIDAQEKELENVKKDKYGHSEIISDLKEMYRERIDWLESIKDRVVPQPKQWSEEDIRVIERACVALRAYANGDLPEYLPSELLAYADRLQSLKPQSNGRNDR